MTVRNRRIRKIDPKYALRDDIPCSLPTCDEISEYAAYWEQDVKNTDRAVHQMRRYCQWHAQVYAAKHGVEIEEAAE